MRAETGKSLASRRDPIPGAMIHARTSDPGADPDAPVVVLVHGLVISSLYMIPTAERLAPFHHVLAPDLPGFGRSSKPPAALTMAELADALAAWLEQLTLREVVLVGNSLGCQIIVELAARHAPALRAAVLAGPTMDRHARTAPRQIARWLVDWTRERPSLAAAHARDYYEAGVRRGLKTFRYALDHRIEEKLGALTAPTLVVRGSRDAIVPQAWAEEVAAGLPRARLHVIDGGPHCVNYSRPLAFTDAVRDFLRELG